MSQEVPSCGDDRTTLARGVRMRQVRCISEQLTDFIRSDYDMTTGRNVAAGEQVRWLPRRRATHPDLSGHRLLGVGR
jgi:hypothetical protein